VAIPDLPLDRNSSPQFVIHRFGIRLLVAQTRLLLNRHWIMRAIQLNAQNPYNTIVAEAFIATYESAQEVVQIVKQLVLYHPALIARWWFFWFHAISAAVVLGAVTILAPSSPFASPAYTGMTHVVTICEAAGKGFRAKNALPFIQRLRDRAGAALARAAQQTLGQPQNQPDTGLSHLDSTPKLVRVGSEPPRVKPEQSPIDPHAHEYPGPGPSQGPSVIPGYMRWDAASPASAVGNGAVVDAMLEQPPHPHFPSDGYDAPTMNYAENWFAPMGWQPGDEQAHHAVQHSHAQQQQHHAHHHPHAHSHSASASIDYSTTHPGSAGTTPAPTGPAPPMPVSAPGSAPNSATVPLPHGIPFEDRLTMDNDVTLAMGLAENGADGGLYFNEFVNNLAAAGNRPTGGM
jgi:hypothetical protein